MLDKDRPAHIEELIPGDPIHLGACDAAKTGMGGVWFTGDNRALLWQQPFSKEIQKRLVSFKNPLGDLTNSDLELAGTIMHQHVLGQHAVAAGETAHTLCDNTPAVAWQDKGSTTTGKSAAYLLRLGPASKIHWQDGFLITMHRCWLEKSGQPTNSEKNRAPQRATQSEPPHTNPPTPL
jgi:hypothetical protein